jgi:hypothetical protein
MFTASIAKFSDYSLVKKLSIVQRILLSMSKEQMVTIMVNCQILIGKVKLKHFLLNSSTHFLQTDFQFIISASRLVPQS